MKRACAVAIAIQTLCAILIAPVCVRAEAFTQDDCKKPILDDSINEVVRTVFVEKIQEISAKGLVSGDFWNANKNLQFIVCDNGAAYDTYLVPGKGVVFDVQMIMFFIGQAEALTLDAYLSPSTNQYQIYGDLVRRFVHQGADISDGPLAVVERKALSIMQSKPKLDVLLADSKFNTRKYTIMATALYFLSLHERCHAALGHMNMIPVINKLPEPERSLKRQALEIDADRCAMQIENSDEKQTKGSPIAFFGAMMTVATQSLFSNASSISERDHPSTRSRLSAARDTALKFVDSDPTEWSTHYKNSIADITKYFDDLLAGLMVPAK